MTYAMVRYYLMMIVIDIFTMRFVDLKVKSKCPWGAALRCLRRDRLIKAQRCAVADRSRR